MKPKDKERLIKMRPTLGGGGGGGADDRCCHLPVFLGAREGINSTRGRRNNEHQGSSKQGRKVPRYH